MGYNTRFEGQFELSKVPSEKAMAALHLLATEYPNGEDYKPESLCQWILSADGKQLVWDGKEKFYFYAEWLQWIVERIFTPEGIEVRGEVKFRGEDDVDWSSMEVVDGRVHIYE